MPFWRHWKGATDGSAATDASHSDAVATRSRAARLRGTSAVLRRRGSMLEGSFAAARDKLAAADMVHQQWGECHVFCMRGFRAHGVHRYLTTKHPRGLEGQPPVQYEHEVVRRRRAGYTPAGPSVTTANESKFLVRSFASNPPSALAD